MTSDDSHYHSENEIDCTIAIEQLYAYLDGELDTDEARKIFEEHLEHCRSCFDRLELEKALTRRMNKLTHDQVPERLKNRLADFLDKL